METESKVALIYRCVQLGMDLKSAMILAECTQEEEETLQQDKAFMRRIQFEETKREEELLKAYEIGMALAVGKGNVSPVQWMLTKVNPEKWGNVSGKKKDNSGLPSVNVYLPDNGRDYDD